MFETSQFRKIVSAIIYFTTTLIFLSVNNASADGNQVNFALTDNPGRWFDTGSAIAGNHSIAIASPGVQINFSGNSNTVHTRTSLIYPSGACLLYTSPSPRDRTRSRMPSSA